MNLLDNPLLTRLPDLASGVLSFATELKAAGDPGDYDAARAKVEDMFQSFEARAKELRVNDDDLQLAKYALAAFVDEVVLTSSWALRNQWAAKPLSLQYFNDSTSGEEFYEKVTELQGSDVPAKLEVLEVYYLCLALGFTGKYGDVRGMAKVRGLINGLTKKLQGASAGKPGEISPDWLPADRGTGIATRASTWVVSVACLAVLLIVFVVLSTILGFKADHAVEALRGG